MDCRPRRRAARRVAFQVPHTAVTKASGVVATHAASFQSRGRANTSGHETVDITIPVNVRANVRVGTEEGTLGAGHYTLDSSRPLPKPTAPPSSSSSGSKSLVWIVILVAVVAIASSVALSVVRRRKRTA